MEKPEKGKRDLRDSVTEVAVASAAGAAALVNPVAGALAAGASPAVAAGIKGVLGRLSERWTARNEYVLAWVARLAGIDPDELERRCEVNPELEQLLSRSVGCSGHRPGHPVREWLRVMCSGLQPVI